MLKRPEPVGPVARHGPDDAAEKAVAVHAALITLKIWLAAVSPDRSGSDASRCSAPRGRPLRIDAAFRNAMMTAGQAGMSLSAANRASKIGRS